MAISATFTANFASFYDAVEKADAKLKDFGSGAEQVGAKLTKLGNQFSGVQVVQQATLMVKAVEDLGGTAKLTDKEMQRLGTTVQEAVAKMKALGLDIPANLRKIADETKDVNTATTDWKGSLVSLAGAMGIAFSVDAIVGFGREILSLASNIKDLSFEWGVSIQAVQQFTGAAQASGVKAESVGKSIQFLSGALTDNSKQYQALLKNVGLTAAELNAMPLEDAYRTVLTVIGGIKDEAIQLDAAIALLGPDARKMIGAIRDGFIDASKAQQTFSDDTVKRLADAEAAWGRLTTAVKIYSGEMLAAVMSNLDTMTSSWETFFGFVAAEVKNPGIGGGMFLEQARAAERAKQSLEDIMGPMTRTTQGTTALGGATRTAAEVLADLVAQEKAEKEALAARTKALADAKAKQDAYNKAVQAQADKIKALAASLNGADLVDKANAYLEALESSIPVQKMTAQKQAEINKAMADAIDVYVRAGTIIPRAMLDVWLQTKIASDRVVNFTFNLEELKKRYLDLTQLPKFDPFTVTGNQNVNLGEPPKEDRTPFIIKNIQTLSQALGDLGAVAGGTFGTLVTGAADIGWAFDQATVAAGNMSKGFADIKTGKTAEGMTTVASSALQAAGAFMAATEGASMAQSILTGGAMGAALAPGPYMAYAAAAGMAVGALRGFMNAQAAADAVDDLRMQMLQSVPNIQEFRDQVARAGYDLSSFQGADTVEQVKFRWQELVDAVTANEMRAAFIETAGGIEALRRAAELAGVNIDRMLDQSVAGKELQSEIDALTEAFRFQDESLQTLQETAQRYGFTLAELGPAMQGAELDKQAQQLFKDWEVLNAAGIETVDITNRMGEAVSEYVARAMAMGFEIPNAMRPMLEAMAKSGDLLDAQGNAITDLEQSGVSFSMTMSDGFKRLITVVEKLADSISRSLGIAIDNVPDVEVQGRVIWNVDEIPQSTAPVGPGLEEFDRGSNGFRNFGAGTPVMLHGWEAVVPKDQPGSFATVAASAASSPVAAGGITVVLEQDGKKSAQWIAPYLAGEVYRLRLA